MHVHDGEKLFANFNDRPTKRACVSNIFEVSVSFYKSRVSDILIISPLHLVNEPSTNV